MSSLPRLAIIATVVLLLAGALPASSGAEDGDDAMVAVLFDFGNGIWRWAEVPLPDPANAWCATVVAADQVNYELEYSFSQYGVLLESVHGIEPADDFSKYWTLWTWGGDAWEFSMDGALAVDVANVSAVAWLYTGWGHPGPSSTPNTREPWTQFRGGYRYAGIVPDGLPMVGGMFWSVDLGNGPIDSTLAVADGRVFGVTSGMFNWSTFTFDSLPFVFALDSRTGETLWKHEFGGSKGYEITSPAYGGGTLYVTLSSRKVMALDAVDGDLLWETQLDGVNLTGSPTVYGNRVLVGTGGGELVSILANNGSLEWSADLSGEVYLASPTVREDIVYIGTDNATLHAIHLGNGTEARSVDLPGRLRGTPLVLNDRMYVISAVYQGFSATEGSLHHLDLDGNELWNVSIGPTASSPSYMGGLILVGSQSGLWAIGGDNGTVVWRYQDLGPISASAVTNDFGALVLSNVNDVDSDLHTTIFGIDLDGEVVWKRTLVPHNWALSSVSVADGVAYAATDEGWVYSIGNTPFHADFDIEVDGLKVTVVANSTSVGVNGVAHVWAFEGKQTSVMGDNATYKFKKGGTYQIEYIFVDEFDRLEMVTKEVTVEDPPEDSPAFGTAIVLVSIILVALIITRRR